jgi:tetratricopeptide (TPR) repeat protein
MMIRCDRCGVRAATAGFWLAVAILFAQCAAAQERNRADQTPPPAAVDSGDDSLLQLAQSDVDAKDFAAAAEKYRTYLAAHPADAQIHFQLGYCDTALGQSEAARGEYQKATELDPALAPAFLNLGLTLIDRDPAAAVVPLRRAVELMPGEERPQMLLATSLERAGETVEALAEFAAAEKLDATDAQLHLEYGNALMKANRYANAEEQFRTALGADDSSKVGHIALSECLLAEKRYDEAAAELAMYLKLAPDDGRAHELRAEALLQAGRYDEGTAELKVSGADASVGVNAIMMQYGALMDAKQYDDALAVLAKAEALYPGNAMIHAELGKTYLQRKAYPSAIREFQEEMKAAPDDTNAMTGLATTAYLAKDYPDALSTLDTLAQKESLPPADLYVRADKIGKKAEALGAYEKFLAANTDHNSDMYFAASERVRSLKRELGKK